MRKWLIRLCLVIGILVLWETHQDVLGLLTNFIIAGLIPGTHWSLNSFMTYITVGIMGYGLLRMIRSVRFSMLRRDALLHHSFLQERSAGTIIRPSKELLVRPVEADDLELIQRPS